MVSSDRITRRFIGGVIILTTLFFTVGLSWNFWFIEEPLSQKDVDGDLPFVVSTKSITLKRGDGAYISLVPRRELKERVHLHIVLDDPLLVETLSSITLHPGSNRAVFIPINSKVNHGGRCQMSFTSDSSDMKQLDLIIIDINIVHHVFFGQLSLLIGWTYFMCWSLSYYPQLYENWRRRSVIGLSFDWLSLNMSGHMCYCLFNVAMCYNSVIRAEYRALHPHGLIPVKPNDSFFSLHAVLMNIILVMQCVFFERADQKLSMPMGSFVAGLWGVVFLGLLAGLAEKFSWLQYLYFLSFIKVISTPIKLTPQVYLNYMRRSTEGWSIYMVILDFSGGLLGLMQMFIDAYNYDDWEGTLGNPSKIGLAVLTMSYDVLFMIQHFILYNKSSIALGQRKKRLTDDYNKKFEEYKASLSPQKNTTIKKSTKLYHM